MLVAGALPAGAAKSVARLRRRCRPEDGDLTSPLGLVFAAASSSSESAEGSRPCLFVGRQMLRAISKMACSCGERKEKVAPDSRRRETQLRYLRLRRRSFSTSWLLEKSSCRRRRMSS